MASKPFGSSTKKDTWRGILFLCINKWDSKPERAFCVKNSPVDCFLAKWCADGHRSEASGRQAGRIAKQYLSHPLRQKKPSSNGINLLRRWNHFVMKSCFARINSKKAIVVFLIAFFAEKSLIIIDMHFFSWYNVSGKILIIILRNPA